MKKYLCPILAVLICGCTAEQATEPPASAAGRAGEEIQAPTNGTRLALRTDPLVELYYWVRELAADEEAEIPSGLEEAVGAARALQAVFGSFGGWGPLDSSLFAAPSVTRLREYFEGLPEPYKRRRGGAVSIRGDAVRLATALETLESGFKADLWPTRRSQLEDRLAGLEERFLPKHRAALSFMMDSLGIAEPEIEVPVYLVTRSNPPGAMTYFLAGGKPVVVARARPEDSEDSLIELLLHEGGHTRDMASKGGESAFETLRTLLEEKGVARGDYLYGVVPHTLMFVQAEETARRFYNPEHVAYGETSGVYERVGPIATIERREWRRYLAGEQTRYAALRAIVGALDVNLPKSEEPGS